MLLNLREERRFLPSPEGRGSRAEDRWSGMLLGREGQVNIPLATVDQVSPDGQHLGHIDHVLHLTWYRYDTGRYDVTAYVSL